MTSIEALLTASTYQLPESDTRSSMLLRTSTAGPCAMTPPPSYRWYMVSARSSGRSTAWTDVAATAPAARPATLAAFLIAATAAPLHAGGAARAFAHDVHVVLLPPRQLVERGLHHRVGQALALVRLDPGLDRLERAAGGAREHAGGQDHGEDGAD